MARMKRAAILALVVLLAACGSTREFTPGGASLSTQVQDTWKDPKYAAAPMSRIFVISLMKVEPGGRSAVEDAIVARLASAGVDAVPSHRVMSNDAEKPGPSLEEAIAASGAQGVLMVDVKSIGSLIANVGTTVNSIMPDTMASYNYLKGQNEQQPGDYKVAHIVSEVYLPSMGRQVWTAYTNTYDASNLARNLPDYARKLVDVMAKDRIIAARPS
jgi:hypothetical protein